MVKLINKTKRRKRKRFRSEGEKIISDYLNKSGIEFEKEKTFDDCLSDKNRHLRFDFFIPSLNLLIEYQGQHHYQPVNKKKRAYYVHLKTKIHDEIKRAFVEKNNINFLEIPYQYKDSIIEILKDIIK